MNGNKHTKLATSTTATMIVMQCKNIFLKD
jgi:hypothetical protein